jgi:hypothetical protein
MRLGAAMAGVIPDVSQRVARRLGGDKVADQLASAQRDKR